MGFFFFFFFFYYPPRTFAVTSTPNLSTLSHHSARSSLSIDIPAATSPISANRPARSITIMLRHRVCQRRAGLRIEPPRQPGLGRRAAFIGRTERDDRAPQLHRNSAAARSSAASATRTLSAGVAINVAAMRAGKPGGGASDKSWSIAWMTDP